MKVFFKKVTLNFLVLLISGILALAVGEIAVRLILPQDRLLVRLYQKPDEDIGSRGKPNVAYYDTKSMPFFSYTVRTNNMGFRMEHDVDSSARNVLFMGDSFTFGWPF